MLKRDQTPIAPNYSLMPNNLFVPKKANIPLEEPRNQIVPRPCTQTAKIFRTTTYPNIPYITTKVSN